MRGFTFLVVAAVAGIGFTATTPKADAQVSGLPGTSLLALARGFMVLVTSMVT
jgi:hypothetical protein